MKALSGVGWSEEGSSKYGAVDGLAAVVVNDDHHEQSLNPQLRDLRLKMRTNHLP